MIIGLNKYIAKLENKIQENITLTENLKQSMKEIIVEDFLQQDGRLKKFMIQSDRNNIYNGIRSEEQNLEL